MHEIDIMIFPEQLAVIIVVEQFKLFHASQFVESCPHGPGGGGMMMS